jgi:uncharacterized protein YbjT (DUF2867 family)
MPLLVLGGTGTLGRQIVRQALREGFVVRCLVRNIRKAKFLKEWGAELLYGDLNLPATLPQSLKGITAIIDASTARSTDNLGVKGLDWGGKLIILQVAKNSQVKRFIFFSLLNSDQHTYIPLMQLKSIFEFVLVNSAIPYTIFQIPGFFQSLIGQYALPILEQQPVYVTKEESPISYIDTADIAQFAIRSLFMPHTINSTFKLGGSDALLSTDLIQQCEELSGQKARLNKLSLLSVKYSRYISNFFQWTWNISDRLAFIEIFSGKQDFSVEHSSLEKKFKISPEELLDVKIYFKQYFEQILTKLKDLN